MNNITLLVMAAGMGTRYGSLKQLDPVGPYGETIIDYSVFDAIRSGFNKVVFIIRKEFENDFKSNISNKYKDKIEVEFAFQDLNDLPNGYICPVGREKPWGTGHAILSSEMLINEPFVAINGDDFYGRESFEIISNYYRNGGEKFSMVAFQLNKTLSTFGGVTRGLCTLNKNMLDTVIETSDIEDTPKGIISSREIKLNGEEPVSMNLWGFTPVLFDYLKKGFYKFLTQEGSIKNSEYLIPSVINDLINQKQQSVEVLRTKAQWFGVTYKKDKPFVVNQILRLINNKVYPTKLF